MFYVRSRMSQVEQDRVTLNLWMQIMPVDAPQTKFAVAITTWLDLGAPVVIQRSSRCLLRPDSHCSHHRNSESVWIWDDTPRICVALYMALPSDASTLWRVCALVSAMADPSKKMSDTETFREFPVQVSRQNGAWIAICVPACSDRHGGITSMPCFVYHIARYFVGSRRTTPVQDLKLGFIGKKQPQLMKTYASYWGRLRSTTCMSSFVYHFVKLTDSDWNMIRRIRRVDCLGWQALSYWGYMQTFGGASLRHGFYAVVSCTTK